jgi:hypothetical protein
MKDSADNTTVDLFPTPKKRGRPATGKAKTAAERQANYRCKKAHKECKDNLNIWIEDLAKMKLDQLAEHYQLSREAMIEKLINEAKTALNLKNAGL